MAWPHWEQDALRVIAQARSLSRRDAQFNLPMFAFSLAVQRGVPFDTRPTHPRDWTRDRLGRAQPTTSSDFWAWAKAYPAEFRALRAWFDEVGAMMDWLGQVAMRRQRGLGVWLRAVSRDLQRDPAATLEKIRARAAQLGWRGAPPLPRSRGRRVWTSDREPTRQGPGFVSGEELEDANFLRWMQNSRGVYLDDAGRLVSLGQHGGEEEEEEEEEVRKDGARRLVRLLSKTPLVMKSATTGDGADDLQNAFGREQMRAYLLRGEGARPPGEALELIAGTKSWPLTEAETLALVAPRRADWLRLGRNSWVWWMKRLTHGDTNRHRRAPYLIAGSLRQAGGVGTGPRFWWAANHLFKVHQAPLAEEWHAMPKQEARGIAKTKDPTLFLQAIKAWPRVMALKRTPRARLRAMYRSGDAATLSQALELLQAL